MGNERDSTWEALHTVVEWGHCVAEGMFSALEGHHALKAIEGAEGGEAALIVGRAGVSILGGAIVADGMGVGLPGVHSWPEDQMGHSGGVSSGAPASDPADPGKVPADYGSHPGEPGYAVQSVAPGMSEVTSCTDPGLSTAHTDTAQASYDHGVCHETLSSDANSFHH